MNPEKAWKPMHPNRAPQRISPFSNTSICRFWSYGTCKRFEHDGEEGWIPCEFDHQTCHCCLKPGHKAQDCDEYKKTRQAAAAAVGGIISA